MNSELAGQFRRFVKVVKRDAFWKLFDHFGSGWKTGCGSEPCERRDAGDRRETASVGPIPVQVTDLRLLPPDPRAAVSRGVERFAEQPVFWPDSSIKRTSK
jgi:hypothetical protein